MNAARGDPARRKERAGHWIFVIAFALVLYANGAAFVESFVNYPSWRLIGSTEFVAYHRFIGPRVLAFLAAPALLGTVFTVLILWVRPTMIFFPELFIKTPKWR